jgi:hypothetical protein
MRGQAGLPTVRSLATGPARQAGDRGDKHERAADDDPPHAAGE